MSPVCAPTPPRNAGRGFDVGGRFSAFWLWKVAETIKNMPMVGAFRRWISARPVRPGRQKEQRRHLVQRRCADEEQWRV